MPLNRVSTFDGSIVATAVGIVIVLATLLFVVGLIGMLAMHLLRRVGINFDLPQLPDQIWWSARWTRAILLIVVSSALVASLIFNWRLAV